MSWSRVWTGSCSGRSTNRRPSAPGTGSATSASTVAYNASVEPNRKRLAHILGVRDPRVTVGSLLNLYPFQWTEPLQIEDRDDMSYGINSVRWSAFGDVTGEGLRDVFQRRVGGGDRHPRRRPVARAARRADARSARRHRKWRTRLAESGCRVIVPLPHRPNHRATQRPGQADQPRVRLSLGLRAGPAHHRLRGAEGAGARRLAVARQARLRARLRSASSAMARGARSPSTPRRSTPGSTPSASAAISTTATRSGASRSTATCSACWTSSATPSWPAWWRPGR